MSGILRLPTPRDECIGPCVQPSQAVIHRLPVFMDESLVHQLERIVEAMVNGRAEGPIVCREDRPEHLVKPVPPESGEVQQLDHRRDSVAGTRVRAAPQHQKAMERLSAQFLGPTLFCPPLVDLRLHVERTSDVLSSEVTARIDALSKDAFHMESGLQRLRSGAIARRLAQSIQSVGIDVAGRQRAALQVDRSGLPCAEHFNCMRGRCAVDELAARLTEVDRVVGVAPLRSGQGGIEAGSTR